MWKSRTAASEGLVQPCDPRCASNGPEITSCSNQPWTGANLATIEELHNASRVKGSDKWAIYLCEYQRLLSPLARTPRVSLETGTQNGGSLERRAKHFPATTHIIACDNDPACLALTSEHERIRAVAADANSDEAQAKVTGIGDHFGIFVDDGSLSSADIIQK